MTNEAFDTMLVDDATRALTSALVEHYPRDVAALVLGGPLEEDSVQLREAAQSVLQDPSSLHEDAAVVLALFASLGPRVWADTLRREGLVQFRIDVEDALRALISVGFGVMIPEPGARTFSLQDELEARRFMQREVFLPASLCTWAQGIIPSAPRRALEEVDASKVHPLTSTSTHVQERNLLFILDVLREGPLLLNKDSSPNRRSFARLVEGLEPPPLFPPRAPDDVAQEEGAAFLLSLGRSLGLIRSEDSIWRATSHSTLSAFFCAPPQERARQLLTAYQECTSWSELRVAQTGARPPRAGRTPDRIPLEHTLAGLSGARGQVLSDLSSVAFPGWFHVEHLVDILFALDRGYLAKALTEQPFEANDPNYDLTARRFIHAFLTYGLCWLGLAELGVMHDQSDLDSPSETFVIRLDASLFDLMQVDDTSSEASRKQLGKPLLISPNFEVTVILPEADLGVLYGLHNIARRTQMSEHTAHFTLSPQSVQRGYSGGESAEEVIAFLQSHTRVPIPDAVLFALRDWERVHKKVTIYADGTLLTHPNPDRFDLILGSVVHTWSHEQPVVPITATSAFLATTDLDEIRSLLRSEEAHIVDYLSDLPPTLLHVQGHQFDVLDTGLDIVTRVELEKIATSQLHPEDPEGERWTLDIERIQKRWPTHTAKELLTFLAACLGHPVPTRLSLTLRVALGESILAALDSGATLFRTADKVTCDALLDIPDFEEYVLVRLGPTALLMDDSGLEDIQALMEELGLGRLRDLDF